MAVLDPFAPGYVSCIRSAAVWRVRSAVLLLVLIASAVLPAHGQQAPAFRVELLPFYHSLSNDYGHWSGATARLWYRSKRFTPVLDVSSQTRPEGSQQSVGLSSYIVFNDRFY